MNEDAIRSVNLGEAFASFAEFWQPRLAGSVNNCHVKLAKVKGEFIWHRHELEDELFLVIRGVLRILLRTREIVLRPGEMVIIPRGVEHCPVADEETHILLFEPSGTLNTGNVRCERTVDEPPALG